MMPAYLARLRTGLGAVRNERKRRTPGSVSDPGVVTTSVMSAMSAGDGRPLLGDDITRRGLLRRGRQLQGRPLPGTVGSAAYAVLLIVPAAIIALSSIGRVEPARKRFWPSVEYRYSSHSRAAAGSGAVALIAWS